jgi:hypothetical protein
MKKFLHQIQIQFLNMNQVFQKFFTNLSFVRLPYVVTNTSAVRCVEMSAALSDISVNEISTFLKCLFFLQSVYFGSFLG